ncbi:MAG TPA: LuxR C-terminal-related transcriptional regulator [Solirubrobacterales bacterium]|nr:LuxR C-terminal-related transcriptional regulator [Solirubrobacterales bacterium]
MPTVRLTEAGQDALRALIALEPTAGEPLPARTTLEIVTRLISCDVIRVGVADCSGRVEEAVKFPASAGRHPFDGWHGSFQLGLVHQADHPEHRRSLSRLGMTDGLLLGFERDRDRVVQLAMHRRHQRFSEADVALLRTLTPALQRLLRDRVGRPPSGLTAQECRVLELVAAGLSNADVATRMCLAPSTVRKHLEHAFRKLGVSNRLAAAKAFEGHQPLAATYDKPSPERV